MIIKNYICKIIEIICNNTCHIEILLFKLTKFTDDKCICNFVRTKNVIKNYKNRYNDSNNYDVNH